MLELVENRQYTVELKQQAIELANKSLDSTKKAAGRLGLSGIHIHQWRKRLLKSNPPSEKTEQENPLEELNQIDYSCGKEKLVGWCFWACQGSV